MMKWLASSSNEATCHLKDMIENIKISDFNGKNVEWVVSLIQGTYKCLEWIKKVPDDFQAQILDVVQSSSIKDFNEYFKHCAKTLPC